MSDVIVLNANSTTLTLEFEGNSLNVDDFVKDDIVTMTPINPHTTRVVGSKGNVNINLRVDKDEYTLLFRVKKNLLTDEALTNFINQEVVKTAINGVLSTVYYKNGERMVDKWLIRNGSIGPKPTATINNTDGSDVMEYTIEATCKRSQ